MFINIFSTHSTIYDDDNDDGDDDDDDDNDNYDDDDDGKLKSYGENHRDSISCCAKGKGKRKVVPVLF
jgi:hypothetical protein